MNRNLFLQTLLATSLLAAASSAHANDLQTSVEGVLGLGYSESELEDGRTDVTIFGIRWAHDFNDRWGLEFGYSQQPDFTYEGENGHFLEASARLSLFENERLELLALAGAGILRYRGGSTPATSQTDETATAHLGLALNISLTERLYLRPDLRYRRIVDILAPVDDDTTEATFGVGWRF